VSIVRVGLAETKKFAEGYEAIFGSKTAAGAARPKARKSAKKARPGTRGKAKGSRAAKKGKK
jgi:hypothetical protein